MKMNLESKINCKNSSGVCNQEIESKNKQIDIREKNEMTKK